MTSVNPDLDEILKVALRAVSDASIITRTVQTRVETIRQHTKDDRSPVTVADYAAQALIAARLNDAWGELKLVGEEDASSLRISGNASLREAVTEVTREVWDDARVDDVLDAIDLGNHDASAERYWTLDPIDGTKGFLRGGQYAVSLALIENGTVTLGVLGCPNMSSDFERPFDSPDSAGCLFYASLGNGSWTVIGDADTSTAARLTASATTDLTSMRLCESVEAGHSRLDESARIFEHLGGRGRPARLDSQCKYAVVARGQADAYLRLPTSRSYVEKIWDHAAGKIVAEEAGAITTDIRGNDLDFSKGSLLSANRGVICTSPAFHIPIIRAIGDLNLFPN
jgi:3'(2'), 5'-bisphosphate nucleotidase